MVAGARAKSLPVSGGRPDQHAVGAGRGWVVAMGEQDRLFVGRKRVRYHPVGPCADVGSGLAARYAVAPRSTSPVPLPRISAVRRPSYSP